MPIIRDIPGRIIPFHRCAGALNMAIDQVLLESVDRTQRPTLRLYGWSEPTLSLGYFQSRDDRHRHPPSRDLSIVRRATGGGAIVHHHELTYSIAVPVASKTLGANRVLYQQVHEAMIATLSEWSVAATTFADSGGTPPSDRPFLCFRRRTEDDLVTQGYKILGSAQRRSRQAILQHGSLLLKASCHAPELPGINDLTGRSVTIEQVAESFAGQIQGLFSSELSRQALTEQERSRANEIVRDRFGAAKWINRR